MEVVTNVTTQTKQDLFLYNANPDGNPIVTALVQTPRIIDYKDVGEGKWKYKEESIRNAITDLIGYQVEDEQHKGTGDKSFATITNAGYCPKYNGGYVEMEVFKPEYHDLMRNIAENMEKGIAPKKGFSTEVLVKKAIPEGDHYDITDMKYNGLIWTKEARDPDTGICSVKLNKKSIQPFLRSDKMTEDKLKKLQEDYDTLNGRFQKLEQDYQTGGAAYKKLATEFKEGKNLYQTAQSEIDDLKAQLTPIWKKDETERIEMLNKIVENADEDSQKVLRKSLENQSKEELTVLFNAMAPTSKGATRKPPKKTRTDNEPTVEEVLKAFGRL